MGPRNAASETLNFCGGVLSFVVSSPRKPEGVVLQPLAQVLEHETRRRFLVMIRISALRVAEVNGRFGGMRTNEPIS